MKPTSTRILATLMLLAAGVQTTAMIGVTWLRGSPTAYAFQSRDAEEYVALARGLAWSGQFRQLDGDGRAVGGPDTWRVPGYPAFLALAMTLVGDNPLRLLMVQQILAAACVPLFHLIVSPFARPRFALLAAVAWAVDPFRVYCGLWLMAETLFVFLLLAAVLMWVRFASRDWLPHRAVWMGALAGLLVLVRPIGVVFPALAVIGVAVGTWHQTARRFTARPPGKGQQISSYFSPVTSHFSLRIKLTALCALLAAVGAALLVVPWLARNNRVAGHVALSHQSGFSFTYHKVMDVILWSQGRGDRRFDPQVHEEIRSQIDQCLREKWAARFGPLTPEQQAALNWHKLNYGWSDHLDPFVASSLAWEIGWELLAGREWAAVQCFAVQGVSLLTFPLMLVLRPPAGAAAPMTALLGSGHGILPQLIALLIGLSYTALVAVVLIRFIQAAWRRLWPAQFFALFPAAVLFVMSLPSEDPRFRLPIVPLLWLLAVGRMVRDRNGGSNVPLRTESTCRS